ncbi:MAG: DsbA family oxidoreductase [Xanthobacteraceae bacterium]|nr:DsbA family oxidoreductase [Xanthobacteraceae bacterium]
MTEPARKSLTVDVVSDVVCPWCYIGKKRLEDALAEIDDVDVTVRWHPFFLNPWVPREGISREDYLTKKFGSVAAYNGMAGRVAETAAAEGLLYRPDGVRRQPNTLDCHRLIHWAAAIGRAGEMKQKLMELYFRGEGDLTDREVLVEAAAACGLDRDETRRRLAGDEDVELVSRQAEQAARAGVSGVPTFILGGTYGLSGAQPAEQLAAAIRQVAAELAAQPPQ